MRNIEIKSGMIFFEVIPGSNITNAVREAMDFADKWNINVVLEFNSRSTIIMPSSEYNKIINHLMSDDYGG